LPLSGKNLDGSERMSVAGHGGVLAYPIGELSGDQAALLRAELSRTMLPLGSVQWTASGFFDAGSARAVHALAGQPTQRSLSDAGLGIVATAGQALMRLQLARRLGGGTPTSEPVGRTRALLQAGWTW
jgi:hemolysin activation/secretion protein